ncbi:MAG: alpha/beta hydrolase [Clostridia bacterium]|nr:alpha/beta hydrolase [Clostridia bacterium]
MFSKITSFIMGIVTFVLSLLGISIGKDDPAPKMPELKTYVEDGLLFMDNVPYGNDAQQTVDIIIPENTAGETSLFFHIHGGAWVGGDKSYGKELAVAAAKKYNIVGVTIDYRLLANKRGNHRLSCKTLLEDIDNAMKAVRETCLEKGITLKSALVRGDSAGGHLALLYSYLYKNSSPVHIGLVESNCGPTDLTDRNYLQKDWAISRKDMMKLYGALIGKDVYLINYGTKDVQQKLWAVSPCCYVSADVPATIFSSSGKDVLVPVSNGDRLDEMLNAVGVDHYYTCFDYGTHCCRDALDAEKSDAYDDMFEKMMAKYVL